MTIKATLQRKSPTIPGKVSQIFTLLRQLPGLDEPISVGSRLKWGSGPKWTVIAIETAA